MSIAMRLAYTVDINEPLVTRMIGTLLIESDIHANTIVVTVKDGGQPATFDGVTGVAYFLRADGYEAYCPGSISDNVLTIPLPGDCYGYPGDFVIRVKLVRTSENASRTILRIVGTVENDGDGTLIDPANVIYSLGELLANEETRQSNEASRVNAESARASAENSRESAESERDAAETTRLANEDTRETNETDRQTDESTRQTAETGRISAEEMRTSNEGERVEQEANRANAEASRSLAETIRVSNEASRQGAESTREVQEAARVLAEDQRSTSETLRTSAEETRQSAETARQQSEQARQTEIAKLSGMTVSETSVDYGTAPQATLTEQNGVNHLIIQVERGPQGASYTILGSAYASVEELEAGVASPKVGDQYNVGASSPYTIYRWTGEAWESQGQLQGVSGPYYTPVLDANGNLSWTNNGGLENPATQNLTGPQGPTGAQGETGAQGAQGVQGPQGEAGPNTVSVQTTTELQGLLRGDGAHVSAATAGVDYAVPAVDVAATLLASAWAGTGAPYTQDVTITGMTATAKGDASMAMTATDAQEEAAVEAQLKVTAQAANSITVQARGTCPTIDLPIVVRMVG